MSGSVWCFGVSRQTGVPYAQVVQFQARVCRDSRTATHLCVQGDIEALAGDGYAVKKLLVASESDEGRLALVKGRETKLSQGQDLGSVRIADLSCELGQPSHLVRPIVDPRSLDSNVFARPPQTRNGVRQRCTGRGR